MTRMKLTNGRPIDNFVPYDTKLYEKVVETEFTQEERLIVDTVIRETIGYESRKKEYKDVSVRLASKPLSVRRMSELTGLTRMTTYRWINRLVDRNILLQKWVYCPKKQFDLGINYEFWQWDSKGDFLALGEYIKLHELAKEFVKDEFERRFPDYKFVKAKKQDKADFRMMWIGSHRYNAIIKVKTSWVNGKLDIRIKEPKPNTYYFFVNKNITFCEVVLPEIIEGQVAKVARPIINTNYLDISKDDMRYIVKKVSSNNYFEPNPVGVSPKRSEGIITSLITQ